MWWAVWLLMIAASLVGAFFLLRDLWRKVMALAGELAILARRVGELSARAAQLQSQFQPAGAHNPLALTQGERHQIRTARVARQAAARAARAQAHRRTREHWDQLMGKPPRGRQ